MNTTSKPYTVPRDDAPDETFVKVYWRLIQDNPRWLAGLKRPDGTPYLQVPISLNNRNDKRTEQAS